ncbi:unnamed protein product [Pleuronectes platessa]|uniref:Uncharacterized protein n=1 Tax=Pleuronectes platessa TaxID=8262 RepID=A0A9N7YMY3_PLEPL|nr:unnamed protein product [Pleuronectes platessa]
MSSDRTPGVDYRAKDGSQRIRDDELRPHRKEKVMCRDSDVNLETDAGGFTLVANTQRGEKATDSNGRATVHHSQSVSGARVSAMLSESPFDHKQLVPAGPTLCKPLPSLSPSPSPLLLLLRRVGDLKPLLHTPFPPLKLRKLCYATGGGSRLQAHPSSTKRSLQPGASTEDSSRQARPFICS